MRVKKGVKARRRRNRVLKLAKGFRGRRKNCYRRANQAVERALNYSTRDRRQKRRDFRALWIVAHQRGRPPERHHLLAAGRGHQEGRRGARPQDPGGPRRSPSPATSRRWSRPRRPRAPWPTFSRSSRRSRGAPAQAIAAAADEKALEDLRVRFLGKKGELSQVLRGMGAAGGRGAPQGRRGRQPRPRRGGDAPRRRRKARLEAPALEAELSGPAHRRDAAGPGAVAPRPPPPHHPGHRGDHRHLRPARATRWRAGPRSSSTGYNFEALNIPADHPARDMQDTFYVDESTLRPGVRPGRSCCAPTPRRCRSAPCCALGKPPVRIICPGRVYRSDYDQTHSPMFHQVEGLCVDRGHHLRRPEGHAGRLRPRLLRPGHADALPPQLLPLHRAERRGGRLLLHLRRQGPAPRR